MTEGIELDARLAYLTCPSCHEQIRTPFTRGGPPTAFVHHRPKHASCRLVLQVAAVGQGHVVHVVPDRMSIETALLAALQRWDGQMRQLPHAS